MKKPKYVGNLNKPITPGLIKLAMYGGFDGWLKSDHLRQEYLSRMFDLLDHYKIDPSSKDCWFALASELAADHIKGFSVAPSYKRRGRPRKIDTRSLRNKRPRGRPEKHSLADAEYMVRIVDEEKKHLMQKEKRKVTDKEILRNILTEYAMANDKSVSKLLREELKDGQKRFSNARSKIRKSQEK